MSSKSVLLLSTLPQLTDNLDCKTVRPSVLPCVFRPTLIHSHNLLLTEVQFIIVLRFSEYPITMKIRIETAITSIDQQEKAAGVNIMMLQR
ncbi:hypothetical protein NPIL_138051 [Nephila pilipes]|uniref:Uncharacterized protein n=1 Tax=Nephila pilipes TaxID=299642 RepID=A0A8X6M8Y1_NEPPI|nr:hypothetical protein NPIL_138051 [Nephila pilipes]